MRDCHSSVKNGAKEHLGLPPMQLAETSDNRKSILHKCMKKLLIFALCMSVAIITYVMLLGLNDADESNPCEIIVLSMDSVPNQQNQDDNMDIFFRRKNSSAFMKRRKRNTEIIIDEFNPKQLISSNKTTSRNMNSSESEDKSSRDNSNSRDVSSSEERKKDLIIEENAKSVEFVRRDSRSQPINSYRTYNAYKRNAFDRSSLPVVQLMTPQMADTCLLAKLLKNHNHHLHAIYDGPQVYGSLNPTYASAPYQYTSASAPYSSYAASPPLYSQARDSLSDFQQRKPHPQDIEISKLMHTTEKPIIPRAKYSNGTKARSANCPQNTVACGNNDVCLPEKQWCDGVVDCSDVSDESDCNCASRVDKYRLCDGYFDCPFGEDELGCYGCSENTFSCEDVDLNSKSTCFTKEQRCNNVIDCPNRRDESDCNLLSTNLSEQPMFAVSNTEGFLQRNFKGFWYPVCNNPYMWAHDACLRETGIIIRPPFMQMIPIDPFAKITYINTSPSGAIHLSDSCSNSSAVYITCPDLMCGTRVTVGPQLLRDNAAFENRLFGRNKRFLLEGLPFPTFFVAARFKRDIDGYLEHSNEETSPDKTVLSVDRRDKRIVESRVVGGKPSQPAAWPWIVAMHRDGKFHCGGVILNERWIISAAHCVDKYWEHYYEIQIGMLRRFSYSPQEHSLQVTHIIVNQNYDRIDMKNDLSLLRVKPSIQFSRWIRPVCLPNPDTAGPEWLWGPPPGTICTAIGWGATEEHGPDPDHIREVEVPVWSQCKHKEDRAGREICAGLVEGGKDACQGDSGGPLLCRNPLNSQQWYVAGIVSHGDGCGRKGEPGVYTRVSIFVNWIKHHIMSKSYPTTRPKQECPGFRCNSGLLKCLSRDKVCDKIVDCLEGEDERNCILSRSADLKQNATNVTKKQHIADDISDLDQSSSLKVVHQTSIPKSNEDFGHASTVEISVTDSEEVLSKGQEAKSNKDDNKMDQTFLQRGGQFVENVDTSISKELNRPSFREADVTVDFTDFESTTTAETMDPNEVKITESNAELNTDIITTTEKNIDKIEDKQFSIDLPLEDFKENLGGPEKTNTSNFKDLSDISFENDNLDNSELERVSMFSTAKIRQKLPLPKSFECTRIIQTIPFNLRCNHKADCEDGTDELGCSCVDYLTTFDRKLICDGKFDCANGQDEHNCYGCRDDQFLCKSSQKCLQISFVCDGNLDCPQGEDELDCYALTNGKKMELDTNGKPNVRLEGYITKKHNNSWNIMCNDNLSVKEQEDQSNHICRYLGFSKANRLLLKYINMENHKILESGDDEIRVKRNTVKPRVVYREANQNRTSKDLVIDDPEFVKEKCIPNISKICMTLYVFCERTLFTDSMFDIDFANNGLDFTRSQEITFPWIAKVHVEGSYRCTGVLIDLSWVLLNSACLWDSLPTHQYITVVLGTQQTLRSTHGPYEQTYQVDVMKDFYESKVTLLHLKDPAHYSSMVKPMIVSSFTHDGDKKTVCVAVGEDNSNNTVSVFLEETQEDCSHPNRCFRRYNKRSLCDQPQTNNRSWTGIISCHDTNGWHPSASFVIISGECGVGNTIIATDIGNLRSDIKKYLGSFDKNSTVVHDDGSCGGIRCGRGRCVEFKDVCNGVNDCENAADESTEACENKDSYCATDIYQRGCECSTSQMKCKNGKCIHKEKFNDGEDNCGDGSDEPINVTCAQYIMKTVPLKLCDGIQHCHDRSDEDPMFCKCFSKRSEKCGTSDYCVAPDMICDGVSDCPNGEDEQACLVQKPVQGAPYGTGVIMARSHGVWHTKCFSKPEHTRLELETICRQLGFLNGHAKQLNRLGKQAAAQSTMVEVASFDELVLNSNTKVKLRNSDLPLARAVFANHECYPVVIECM